MELALRAEGVDDAIGDHRHGARPFIEAEVVAVGRRIGVAPHRCASLRVERLEHFLVADAMEQQHPVLDDSRSGKGLANLLAPDDLRAGRSPRLEQRRTGVRAVAIGPEELRPVRAENGHAGGESGQGDDDGQTPHTVALYRKWRTGESCQHTRHVD